LGSSVIRHAEKRREFNERWKEVLEAKGHNKVYLGHVQAAENAQRSSNNYAEEARKNQRDVTEVRKKNDDRK
jgi:hypothetical protein